MAKIPTVTMTMTEDQYKVLLAMVGDAWAYRQGEASSIDDPDLDPDDRDVLLRYEAFVTYFDIPVEG